MLRKWFSRGRRPIDKKRHRSTARAKAGLLLEWLEERVVLATFADAAPTLTLTLAKNDAVGIVANASTYTLDLTAGTWSGTNDNNVSANANGTILTVQEAAFSQVNLTDTDTGTSVTFNDSGNNLYASSFDIDLSKTAAGAITFNKASSFTGTAALTASTTGAITISSGATVTQNAGTLSLTAGGSLTGPTPGAKANIVGPTITLNVTGASSTIGTSGSALQIDATTLNASTAGGDIFITNTTGNLAVGLVSAGATGTGDVSLTATSGSLTDADASTTADIVGATITLKVTGASSTIGTSATNPLEIDATTQLNATTGDGNVDVTQTSGDLPLGSVNAGTGTVLLVATNGAITNANGTTLNITGGTVDLTATSDIGKATAIKTKSSHLVTSVSGSGKVTNIAETNALDSVSATTNAGDVTINFSGGSLSFTASTQVLSASGTSTAVTFENTGGDVNVATVSAGTGNVTLTADDGTIEPEFGGSGATINITGNGGISAPTVATGGAGYPKSTTVELAITGGGGSGGIVAVTTNAQGVVTGVASVVAAGMNYSKTPAASTIDNMSFVAGATVTLTTTGLGNDIGTPPPVAGTSIPLIVNSTLLNATTNDGFIVLANTTGNMALGALNAGAALIELTALGNITDGVGPGPSQNPNPPNLMAVDGAVLTTTGSNGTTDMSFSAIGSSGSMIRTAIGALTATTYDGGVYISDSNSPGMAIGSIVAREDGSAPVLNTAGNEVVYIDSNQGVHDNGTYNVSVTATGYIVLVGTLKAPATATIESTGVVPTGVVTTGVGATGASILEGGGTILARTVMLTGQGSIGVSGGAISLTAQHFSASTTNANNNTSTPPTNGNIYLTEAMPGEADNVVANGSGNTVSVTGTGPGLSIGTIMAESPSGTVTIDESAGALDTTQNSNITANTVNLTGKSGIGAAGSGNAVTVTGNSLSATEDDPGQGIFVKDTSASSVSAMTNNGQVMIEDSGGSLDFTVSTSTPPTGFLMASGGATVSFNNTGGADVELGAVNNAASITAAGAITSNGSSVSGGTVTLTAGTGIGAAGNGNAIQTNVTTLDATTTTGDIFIVQPTGPLTVSATSNGYSSQTAQTGSDINVNAMAGDLTVGTISALGTVTLNTSGALSAQSTSAVSLTANTLNLTAVNGIGTSGAVMMTAASTLSAIGGSGGGLFLSNNKSLSVTSASANGGDVNITALGDLSVGSVSAGTVSAGHAVTLTATGGSIIAAGGSGATINITSTNSSSGAITGVTLGAVGAGYPANATVDLLITSGGGFGGIVAVTTNAQGEVDVNGVPSIVDGGANYTDTPGATTLAASVTAQNATLSGSAIGGAGDPLGTQVSSSITATATGGGVYISDLGTGSLTLTASAAGAGADIDFTSAGSMVLNTVSAQGNAVTLIAAGSITSATPQPVVNITAATLDIVAPGGIGIPGPALEVSVGEVTAADGGANGVSMDDAGPIEIQASDLTGGTVTFDAASITIAELGSTAVVIPNNESLLLEAAGPIVFLDPTNTIETTNGGSITVAAGMTAGSGGVAVLGNLSTIGINGTYSGSPGGITVTADGSITIGTLDAGKGNVTVQSANGIIINGSTGASPNVIAGQATLSGSAPTLTELQLNQTEAIAAVATATAEFASDQSSYESYASTIQYDDASVGLYTVDLATETAASILAIAAVSGTEAAEAGTAAAVSGALTEYSIAQDVADGLLLAAGPAQAIPAVGDGGLAADWAVAQEFANVGLQTYLTLQATSDAEQAALSPLLLAASGAAASVLADAASLAEAGSQLVLAQQQQAQALSTMNTADYVNQAAALVAQQAINALDQGTVIGSPTAPIVLQVTGAVNVTAGPTDSYLQVAGSTAVNQINATGSVTLISTGAISHGSGGGTDITATGLTISAANGIGTMTNHLVTQVPTLSATNTSSGDIYIDNTTATPALDITGISNSGGGNINISNTGNGPTDDGINVTGPISAAGGTAGINITSGSPLTIASNVIGPGAITLTAAADAPYVGNNLTVDSGVTVQSTASSVSLSAGNNIDIPDGSTIAAATNITITGGAASADVDVEGTLTTATQANIGVAAGTNNENTFTITPSASTPITVTGGTAAGSNVLNFNADGAAVTISGDTITATGDKSVTFSDFAIVNILNPAGGGSVTLNAAAGVSDTMVLTGTAPGAGTYTLNGGTPVKFSGVTSFTYNGGTMTETITMSPFGNSLQAWGVATTINGGTGTATLTYNDVVGMSNNITIQPSGVQPGQLADINAGTNLSIAAVTYTEITNLVVNGSMGAGAGDNLTVDGTPGTDSVMIAPTSANNATITDAGQNISATGMGQIAYNGLGGNDALTVTSPAATTVTLTPGAAVDSGTVQMGTAATLVPLSYSNLGTTGTLTVANTGGTRVDTLVYNGTAGDDVFNVESAGGPGEVLLNNQIDVLTPGVNALTLSGLTGVDTYSIAGTLPFTNTNVNGSGGSIVNLSGPIGAVTVNLPIETPGSANPNTTITGYGGTVTLIGVATANLGTSGNSLTVNGTSLNGNATYTATGTSAGTFTSAGLATVFNFVGETSLVLNGSSGAGANDALTVNGTPGADTVTIAPTSANNATITENGLVITATGMGQIAYNGQGGNDALTVTSPAATIVTLTPGAGVDSGTLQMGTAAATLVPLSYGNLGDTGTLTVANAGGTRVDTLVYSGTSGNDAFTVDAQSSGGPGEVFLNNQIDVLTPGVSVLTLSSRGGDGTYSINAGTFGTLPYANININGNGGSISNLSGATGAVTVNLADNTLGSAYPNTTITGYGGKVTLIGVATANLDTNGNSLFVNGTSLNDNITYTPTGTSAGTFTNAGLATVFNFAGDTSTFIIYGKGGTANQVSVDAPAGRATISEANRVVTVTPIGSPALEPVTLATDVQDVNLFGGTGPNTFQVTPAVGRQFASDGNLDNLVVNVNGGPTGANDSLVLQSATGGPLPNNEVVTINRGNEPNSGFVSIVTAGVQWPPINYSNIQAVSANAPGSNVTGSTLQSSLLVSGVAISGQTVVSASQSVPIPGQTGVSASESGTTVTITTPSAHGLQAGYSVTISGFTGAAASYNGTFMVTSVPTLTSFTYTSSFNKLPNGTGGSEVPVPVTPEPVTITTQSPDGLQAGDSVAISGFTGAAAGYNGTFVVTSAPTTTTFTYVPTTSSPLPPVPNATGVSELPIFNLFATEPQTSSGFTQGPTPLVNSLTISVEDLPPSNASNFPVFAALNVAADENPGLYSVVGDQTGNVPISQVIVTDNLPGQPANIATVQLIFAQPLLDDRYTLTIKDNLVDPAGNQLDGASNASDPGIPTFPSGSNGLPANFVARFTVDSRPHIGDYLTGQGGQAGTSGQEQLDINGNGIFDPVNAVDVVNSDAAFAFGLATDTVFSGNFAPAGQSGTGFDELGAYGQVNGQWRWLLSFNGVTGSPYSVVSDVQMNAIPVAGQFNPNINADEIALFSNGTWYIDYNHTNNVGGPGTLVVNDGLQGIPVVGDFDGSGHIEFATFQPSSGLWTFDLNPFGVHDIVTLQWGFPNDASAVPVAADLNGSGITDIGLYVPMTASPSQGSQTTASFQPADWYWLVSTGTPVVGTINTLNHPFNPTPFGNDLYYTFGNGNDLPLVGHWDPPLLPPTSTSTSTPTSTPTPTQVLIAPTVEVAPANATRVLGTIYATGRRPEIIGTAAPGVTVDLILAGSHVKKGTKIVGEVVTNSAGDFSFKLPAGMKHGSYTLEARELNSSGSSDELSVPISFKVGPAPRIKPAKPKSTKPDKAKMSRRTPVQVHPHAVEAVRALTTSESNGHLVDGAVHALVVENRLFNKNGH